jgi:hypothetical protein
MERALGRIHWIGGHQSQSGHCGGQKNLSQLGIETQFPSFAALTVITVVVLAQLLRFIVCIFSGIVVFKRAAVFMESGSL